ncbi:ABC transporter substrate-binding protein [Noviherbaspirillum saxi]|uniref:ABC transporter substrate-binding protein n=1 Tax=Noviherbaspirillum saxi TaxID=2320863 RepID=A0A3A3G5N1_9BURK|nr:ABC transporter substrate-binding protein [Noviherbaspirillum saxi]RJF97435.1 ABC transporter substrate-binding protein [Noviherbaspirillum saxi]
MKQSLGLFLASLTLASAAPQAGAQANGPSGTLRVAINADIRSTNPGVNRDNNTDTLILHLVEGLVAYGENGRAQPLLAHSIDTSADGKTVTFKLRDDVTFHNGKPLTAADVVWSWQRYLEPKTNWVCAADFDGQRGNKIESVEAPDAQTVVFKLNRPQPLLLTQMAALQCGGGAILHKDSVNPDGSWKAPVGTGPYMLQEWRRGEYIDMAAYPGYKSRKGPRDGYTGSKIAYAEKVRWMVIKDDAARRVALIKGQVDLLPGLSVSELEEMGSQPNVEVKSAPTMTVNALLIQSHDPVLANPLLRRALAQSLDLSAITKLASGSTGSANSSMIPTVSPYRISPVQNQGHTFDVNAAKQLVAQSGYKGQPIKLVTNRRYPDMYDQAMMVQSMAAKAGINIELEVLEWATQLDRYQSGNYQLMSFAYSARVDPLMNYEMMLGDREKSKRKVWDNPQAIALYEQAAKINGSDHAARQKLFDQMHKMMLDDVPLIVLFNPGDANAVSKKLEGYAPWALNRTRVWNVKRNGA